MMTRREALALFESALEEKAGTMHEATLLQSLASWDSMGTLSTMAIFEHNLDVTLAPERLAACETAGDLLDLLRDKLQAVHR